MSRLSSEQIELVRNRFYDYLRMQNLRQTAERSSIFEAVYETDDHFDADELYLRLRGNDVAVSRATVYNTLELLVDCNLVVRHQFGNKQAKYERSYRYWQHDHLICLDCNKLFEFCDPRIQTIRDMVSDVFDFEISHHSVNMYGHCKKNDCPGKAAVSS